MPNRALCVFLLFVTSAASLSCSTGAQTRSTSEATGSASPAVAEPDTGDAGERASEDEGDERDEPEPDGASEEDTSPEAAPFLEAREVAPADDATAEPTTEASLTVVDTAKRPPAEDIPDPAPRAIVTSFDLARATGRNTGGGFTSGVGVDPYASEVDQVAPRLLEPAARQYELWFQEPFRTTLRVYSEQFGGILRAERFDVDGRELQLVVFARSKRTQYKVSIYNQKYFYTAVAFEVGDAELTPLWAVDLSPLFLAYREIDDIQLGPDGTLYVNANYPSYAKEVDGETAYIFAVDPEQGELLWQAGPQVSRGDFLVMDDVILTGYGFTAEPDYLFALDAATGALLDRVRIPTAHDRMRQLDGGIQVLTYDALLEVQVE